MRGFQFLEPEIRTPKIRYSVGKLQISPGILAVLPELFGARVDFDPRLTCCRQSLRPRSRSASSRSAGVSGLWSSVCKDAPLLFSSTIKARAADCKGGTARFFKKRDFGFLFPDTGRRKRAL